MGGSTHNGHILTNCPVERSPRHPHVLFLSLHIRTLSLPYYVSYESVFQIHSTLPHGFSLPLSHIARIDLMTLHYYPSLRGFLPQPDTNTLFYSTYTSVPLPLFYLHSSHILHSHNHSIYNTIQSFPFTGTHNTAPLSSLSPSTPTSNSLHQPQWDPNTRDKFNKLTSARRSASWDPQLF